MVANTPQQLFSGFLGNSLGFLLFPTLERNYLQFFPRGSQLTGRHLGLFCFLSARDSEFTIMWEIHLKRCQQFPCKQQRFLLSERSFLILRLPKEFSRAEVMFLFSSTIS